MRSVKRMIATNSSPPSRATISPRLIAARRRVRQRDQHVVAGLVAMDVVDFLEAVEVDRDHAELVATGPCDHRAGGRAAPGSSPGWAGRSGRRSSPCGGAAPSRPTGSSGRSARRTRRLRSRPARPAPWPGPAPASGRGQAVSRSSRSGVISQRRHRHELQRRDRGDEAGRCRPRYGSAPSCPEPSAASAAPAKITEHSTEATTKDQRHATTPSMR